MSNQAQSILIVEDEKMLSLALRVKLEHEGYRVTLANNGQEALEILAKESFDLVLLDLIMPIKDGFQVLRELGKQKLKEIPVFVISNLSQREDEHKVLALGARKFFVKSNTALAEIVGEIEKLESR